MGPDEIAMDVMDHCDSLCKNLSKEMYREVLFELEAIIQSTLRATKEMRAIKHEV